MTAPKIAVVGGGISGLAAAHRLRRELGRSAQIVLVEQSDRLGGKLRTVELAGRPYDVGAEAFLARRQDMQEFIAELGLAGEVVHPSSAGASIRAGGASHPVPKRTLMGVPESAQSVGDVLSPEGAAAVAAEEQLPPLHLSGEDISVGELLRSRVGDEVVDRLVEPLLGGVYAGDADHLGMRATMPALAAAFDRGATSVTGAAAAALPPAADPGKPAPPVFGAFRGGYQQLIDRLRELAQAEIRLGQTVSGLARNGSGWRLSIGPAPAPELLDVDAVVLAVPAPAARRLLADVVPVAAEKLAAVQLASMAVIGFALPADTRLPESTGVLIARGERRSDGNPFTAKAFTFSSIKWPHLRGNNGEILVRGSVGRFGEAAQLQVDDSELVRRVRQDLAEVTGARIEPVDSVVIRWGGGLPQYGVGHLDLVAEVESAVAEVPGLALAGAALHGVGVPACVTTGVDAATTITAGRWPAEKR
ncbi:protoporphyrinogen oxidase [Saccharopolyspora rectivirgula]|jgi:oxygen-dependent protoporphyrinogen oxidase|uniref:Coproporphyrinogen III oxidase n=1 Tax=Saccharopolyspora rectivirgula TaxID=28042 RepID=A0A073BDR2_9PSEU|nr:protoporphyrinogen oxidase [Saccharopolyspora rectivirgula]KEI45924.1 protoporphyrinogen oxidase [Saccharopolyspora rectivirgula]